MLGGLTHRTCAAPSSALFVIGLLWVNSGMGGEVPPSRADVDELLALNGTTDMAKELVPLVSGQFTAAMKQANPRLSQQAVLVINEVVYKYLSEPARTRQLVDDLAPIYIKTFSSSEIRQLVAFYRSPIGQKLTMSLPSITSESAAAGQRWAADIMPGLKSEIVERLKSEGLTGNQGQ
jgi:uncharacterized protein